MKTLTHRLLLAISFLLFMPTAMSATTGMIFAGGCVEDSPSSLCGMGSNATEANVAALLGVALENVDRINSGFTITGTGQQMGTWSISDASITHLAFKSNGYFILGAIQAPATSGNWDNDPSSLGEWDISNVMCPATICGTQRAYTLADFANNGGNIADLSNVRAFSVVPVPAAAWLFISALGAMGWIKRKQYH